MPYMINAGVNVGMGSMYRIVLGKDAGSIEVMFSVI